MATWPLGEGGTIARPLRPQRRTRARDARRVARAPRRNEAAPRVERQGTGRLRGRGDRGHGNGSDTALVTYEVQRNGACKLILPAGNYRPGQSDRYPWTMNRRGDWRNYASGLTPRRASNERGPPGSRRRRCRYVAAVPHSGQRSGLARSDREQQPGRRRRGGGDERGARKTTGIRVPTIRREGRSRECPYAAGTRFNLP
jgi:hypothetical protein